MRQEILAVILVILVIGSLGVGYFAGSQMNLRTITATTFLSSATISTGNQGGPSQFGFGSLPFLTVGPENRTFSIPLEVGATPAATLSFELNASHAIRFSNGTQWVYSPQGVCNPGGGNGTSTSAGWPPGTDICSYMADNYLPENGHINASVNLVPSQTIASIVPQSVQAGFNGNVTIMLHIGLPPGVYSLYVALLVTSDGSSNSWDLAPAPLVVLANSGNQEPNPNYPNSIASSCSISQSRCFITVTESGYSGQIGGFGSIQWSCQKNVPPGGQTCQGAYLSCKPSNIVSGGTAIISCDAQTSYALPAVGTPFSGVLWTGTGPGTQYYVPFVGNFTAYAI
jgi:hypothetical protein